ncbi:hypothetical protein WJX74_006561 [Apatococcus lobatus]|uniref:CSC1/OSCA1-like cytosolic domain-containing protein n=1 Tax=Apatococcus lobatus TaxID=904363 RepID=A0AAW1QXT7_9CHLO
MIFNSEGDDSTADDIYMTTLGHFGQLWTSSNATGSGQDAILTASQTENAWQTAPNDDATMLMPFVGVKLKRHVILGQAVIDYLACLLFFLTCLIKRFRMARPLRKVHASTATIANYTVQITGVPQDLKASDFSAFCSRWGGVHRVELARSDSSLISSALLRSRIDNHLKATVACAHRAASRGRRIQPYITQAEKLEEKLFAANTKVGHLQKARRHNRCVCAFVTFTEEKGRAMCLAANPNTIGHRLFASRETKYRGTHVLVAHKAPEPSDLQWENLECTFWQRMWRHIATDVLKYLLLILGFILVNLTASLRNKYGTDASNPASCQTDCNYTSPSGSLDPSADTLLRYAQCAAGLMSQGAPCNSADTECFKCLCVSELSAWNFGYAAYCWPYRKAMFTQIGTQVAAILIILVVNQAHYILASYTSKFERHHTHSKEELLLAHTIFLGQFLNTSISPLVANASLPPLRSRVARVPVLRDIIFQGQLGDLIPEWYRQVGRSLIITIGLTGLMRSLTVPQRWLWYAGYRAWGRRYATTQQQLDKAYEAPSFDLAWRYGEIMNVVFCTMMYSSGLPVLYPIAALSFALSYWAEKAELLKMCRPPLYHNDGLARQSGSILPYAALWHLGFAAWAFSVFKTFAPVGSGLQFFKRFVISQGAFINGPFFGTSPATDKHIGERVMERQSVFMTVTFYVLLAALLLRLAAFLALQIYSSGLSVLSFRTTADLAEHGLPPLALAKQYKIFVGPERYSIKDCPEYDFAFRTLSLGDELDPLMSQQVPSVLIRHSTINVQPSGV